MRRCHRSNGKLPIQRWENEDFVWSNRNRAIFCNTKIRTSSFWKFEIRPETGPRPRYDKNARVLTLHVGGVSELATEARIEQKFGTFGSIRDVKFLVDKNIGKCYKQ